MLRALGRVACLSLTSLSMLGLAACGDSGGNSTTDAGKASTGGRGGGEILASYTSFPDFLDPALTYTTDGWTTLWSVYTPLVTYAHAEGAAGAELVPGLAESLPDVSEDGRTYKLTLRAGLRYSDGKPVKASDFEHAVKRVLTLQSGGSSFFLKIAGAEKYVRQGRARADISGIVTDDDTRAITITLDRPEGAFPNILAMSFAAPVPGDTPFQNLTKNPPAGVGPYRFANVRVNRGYDLLKVGSFDIEGLPQGKLDKISVKIIKNRRRQTQDTIRNKIDVMNDPPAPDQLREVRERFDGKRYREIVTNSTYFIFLNQKVAPFDKQQVREAVNFAVDKRAISRLFGGLLEPGCNFLPPGMQGYEKIEPCPFGDPLQPPDIAKAKSLVREADATDAPVTVYSADEPESKAVTAYLADVLTQIGLKAKLRIVAGEVYFTTVGNQKTKAQAGFASFSQDFPHPSNFFALVDGAAIQKTNNPNLGNVADEQIDAPLAKANQNADLAAVADDYAAIDRRIVEQAHVVPYGFRKFTVFYSERMDFDGCTVYHPVYAIDFANLCLK